MHHDNEAIGRPSAFQKKHVSEYFGELTLTLDQTIHD